jgi:hypothetical protein
VSEASPERAPIDRSGPVVAGDTPPGKTRPAVSSWGHLPSVRGASAEPPRPEERCWADVLEGRQCVGLIEDDDLLGLCDRHLAFFRGDEAH